MKSEFKIKKFFKIWGEVLFYSVSIYIVVVVLGLREFNIEEAIKSFMPVITNQYWFVNAYLALYLLSPFLNKMVTNLSKEEFKKLIIILIILFSILTMLPLEMALDKTQGCGIIWFVCLYIFAAYIRLHVAEKTGHTKKYFLGYILSGILLAIIALGVEFICSKLGIDNKREKVIQYDNILLTIESICLFMGCRELYIKNDKITKIIETIAPLTFAVYIIHEQPTLIKVLYSNILHTEICYHNPMGIVIVVSSVILIFMVCILIEYIRKRIVTFFKDKIITRKNTFE